MRISDWSSDVCSSDLQSFRPAISRPRFAIGADRREMHQCPAPGGGTGFGDMPRAFDMERPTLAIQHPAQVDHRIRAGDRRRKTAGPAHAGGAELSMTEPPERLQTPLLPWLALGDPPERPTTRR